MNNIVEVKSVKGEYFILDLGPDGIRFAKTVQDLVHKLADFDIESYRFGIDLYKSIVTDVVSFLNIPPVEAIEMCKYVPRSRKARDMIVLLRIRELDVLRSVCQEGALTLYQKLRTQVIKDIFMYYSFDRCGEDYAIIRKTDALG